MPLRNTVTLNSQLRNGLRSGCENDFLLRNWPFSAKLEMTLNLRKGLKNTGHLSCERVSKIERAILADYSSPSLSSTPHKPPFIFSGRHFRPNFGNPKWSELEELNLPLLQAARKSRERSPFQVPLLSLRSKISFLSVEARAAKASGEALSHQVRGSATAKESQG